MRPQGNPIIGGSCVPAPENGFQKKGGMSGRGDEEEEEVKMDGD